MGAEGLTFVRNNKFSFSSFVSTVDDRHPAANFCMSSEITAFPSPYLRHSGHGSKPSLKQLRHLLAGTFWQYSVLLTSAAVLFLPRQRPYDRANKEIEASLSSLGYNGIATHCG